MKKTKLGQSKIDQGITLISLVVTIIILLILAGVTLSLIGGSEGILGKTTHAVDENNVATAKEQVELALADYQAEFFEEKYVNNENDGTKKEYILGKLQGETYTQDYRVETSEDGIVQVYEKSEKTKNLVVTGIVQEDGSIKWDATGEIIGKAEILTPETDLSIVEIQVTAYIAGGKIATIEPIDGALLKEGADNTKESPIFTVTENGEYSFKITATNGESTIVKVTVDNILSNDDILTEVSKLENSGVQELKTVRKTNTGENAVSTYPIDAIVYEGDLILDGVNQVDGATLSNKVYSFGDESDCGTASTNATRTVVVKVDGNLTIEGGVTMTSICNASGYGGPKGMIVYCTGTLTNNGNITMTARGAKGSGEDVYLFKNTDGTYEYVPSSGAAGGARVYSASYRSPVAGQAGAAGSNRGTGGGGSGAAVQTANSGAGSAGTSYSGGSGGGGAWYSTAVAGTANGGAGGHAAATKYSSSFSDGAGGGAGNPGGAGARGNGSTLYQSGSNGTGGLLVLFSDEFCNTGTITSNGSSGGSGYRAGGGGSGGGSINIFYNTDISTNSSFTASGGARGAGTRNGESAYGGTGGAGTVTKGSIATGQFVKQ